MPPLLATCLLLAASAHTQSTVPDTDPGIINSADGGMPIDDSAGWYCTVFTTAQPTGDERKLVSWFSTNPQLAKLKSQTHFSQITSGSSIFSRYWRGMQDANGVQRPPLISSLPAVVVQRPLDGGGYQVVARFQAPSKYFADADTLAAAIAACIRTEINEPGHIFARPWNPNKRPCPDCRPEPKPTPYTPDPGPLTPTLTPKPLVPDVEPPREVVEQIEDQERAKHGREVAVAVVVFLLVLVFCYVKDRQAQTY